MKSLFILTFLFVVTSVAMTQESALVKGTASCQQQIDLKILAMEDATEKCNAPFLQKSEWRRESVSCQKPGTPSRMGSSIEAIFSCLTPGVGGHVVTKGHGQDFRPYAIEQALNQATNSARDLCRSEVKLIKQESITSGCREGVCTVNLHGVFECISLHS